jgi:predicted DsbA family dithiol-disulfide isomerase
MKPTIEAFSDVICPWCYIGKRRLEKALELLGDRHDVRDLWRPFELNPEMPPGGSTAGPTSQGRGRRLR